MLPSVPPQMSVRCSSTSITKTWLFQLILGLILVCHCSYRGVVELLRDLFDLPISVERFTTGWSAADKAAAINLTQDLSAIRVGLQDEIFQGSQPVLVGVDAKSTATWRRLNTGMRLGSASTGCL